VRQSRVANRDLIGNERPGDDGEIIINILFKE
jgi:hypothetical protein